MITITDLGEELNISHANVLKAIKNCKVSPNSQAFVSVTNKEGKPDACLAITHDAATLVKEHVQTSL